MSATILDYDLRLGLGHLVEDINQNAIDHLGPLRKEESVTHKPVEVYVTVNCGNQTLLGMPEIFSQYWECL